MTIELTTAEANGLLWHLKFSEERGMNPETKRALRKIREAVKKSEPLFETQDEISTVCG